MEAAAMTGTRIGQYRVLQRLGEEGWAASEPSVTVAASAPSDPRGSVDDGAPAAAPAPKAPDAAAAAPTPAVAASVKEPSSAATRPPAHAPVDAGVPDAAVIAAPQPPTAPRVTCGRSRQQRAGRGPCRNGPPEDRHLAVGRGMARRQQ